MKEGTYLVKMLNGMKKLAYYDGEKWKEQFGKPLKKGVVVAYMPPPSDDKFTPVQ